MSVVAIVGVVAGALGIVATLATALLGVWRAATQYTLLTAQVAQLGKQLSAIETKVDTLAKELHERISKVRDHVEERLAAMDRRLDDHSREIALLRGEQQRKVG